MYKSYSMELAGRTLTVDIGRVAAQANGAVFIKYGDTTVLSTATASDKPRDGVDFFPLSVEFEEKMYSVGKIPGGFNKREGKASENAIFPKDYRNDVTLNNLVMSVDPECRPEIVAMIGTALAVHISDIPFDGPCAMTQMGLVDGEFIVNPSQKQWDEGGLQLTGASTKEKVIMIEAGANEIPEDQMIEAIYKCHDINQTVIAFMDQIRDEIGKPKHEYESCAIPEQMFEDIKKIVTPEQMEEAVFTDEKQKREENIRAITEQLEEYDFTGCPIIKGSALKALEDPMSEWGDKIMELMDTVDSYIPDPQRDTDKPFLMPIEDVFSITGRGTVATGRVERGVLHMSDEVEIVGVKEETQKTVVTGIEMFRKLLDEAQAGDNIGALLRGVNRDQIVRGQVLAKPGTVTCHHKFTAQVYVLTKDEGGRHTPFFNNYRPQFYFRTTDVTGVITLPEGTEMCMPGDNVVMNVELITPIAIEEGLRFAIREGGRTVGSGVVTAINE